LNVAVRRSCDAKVHVGSQTFGHKSVAKSLLEYSPS
jgi:hypothetical protein